MLRLWPDEVYAGLFGTIGWLGMGKASKPAQQALAPAGTTPAAQLAMLLDGADTPLKSGSRLVVTLAGPVCPVIALPWSAAIRTADERDAYARAHFERAALPVNESFLIHAEFRHHGAPGLAYALPATTVEEIKTQASTRKLNLANVMPAAAVAYCAARLPRTAKPKLILLAEANSVAALAIDKRGLISYDAEPAFGGPDAALRRLLMRLDTSANTASHVDLWSPFVRTAEMEDTVKQIAPESAIRNLEPAYWRRHQ